MPSCLLSCALILFRKGMYKINLFNREANNYDRVVYLVSILLQTGPAFDHSSQGGSKSQQFCGINISTSLKYSRLGRLTQTRYYIHVFVNKTAFNFLEV